MRRHWWAVLMLAWIAWAHSTFPSKDIDQWTPAGATETLDECKQVPRAERPGHCPHADGGGDRNGVC